MRILLVVIILFCTGCFQNDRQLSINYHGEPAPGLTPKIFSEGFISSRFHEHSSPNYSPDGKIMLYTLSCEHEHVIMQSNYINDTWSEPKPASFSGKYSDDGHVWSVDGTKLYFRSRRPIDTDTTDIYKNFVVSYNESRWGIPLPNNYSVYTVSANGTAYYYKENETTSWDIYESYSSNNHMNPAKLGNNINSDGSDATPFIAPDGSYLIFSAMDREDIIGRMDLYISFKGANGEWQKAINLGETINLPEHISRFPRVSPDGKYLFYWCNINNSTPDSLNEFEKSLAPLEPWRPDGGYDGDIYWVSTKIFDSIVK